MNGKTIGIVVVLIIIVGGWFLLSGAPAKAPATEQAPAATDTTATTQSSATGATSTTTTTTTFSGVTIIYGSQGFSPKSVTVPLGATVLFVNQGAGEMWVASAPHPTHEGYDGTTGSQHCVAGYSGPAPFDQCSAGAAGITYRFTFTKAGTWGYHNHGAPGSTGTIIVTPAAN